MVGLRVKVILISVFLCLSLGATAYAATETVQDFHAFQQQNAYAVSEDVRAIRSWMTIPYIAHFYHVPESYLYQSLHISGRTLPSHVPLHLLAARYHRPVDALIHALQTAIQSYRQHHPTGPGSPGHPSPGTKTFYGGLLAGFVNAPGRPQGASLHITQFTRSQQICRDASCRRSGRRSNT